jgi:PAS domain S-box-containing protein
MNIKAYKSSSHSQPGIRLYAWSAALVGLVVIKGVVSLTQSSNVVAVPFGVVYFLLLLLGVVFALRQALQQAGSSRLFWMLMASGYGLWALDQWIFIYYVIGRHLDVPDSSIADPALFMHVVPFMAALAVQPHLNRSRQSLSRASLNFFLLLFFWVFLYAYVIFPHQYLWNSELYGARFDVLYAVENITLVVAAAVASARARGAWRLIYLHLLGASALYALSSTLANFAIDTGRQYNGGVFSLAQTAAVCWFVWVPLRARQLPRAHAISGQPDAVYTDFPSLLAMLAVVSIPLIGVWEAFRADQPIGIHTFRLVMVLVSVVVLATCVFLKEYLTTRKLEADVRVGNLQQRLSEAALSESEALKGSILSSLENLIAVLNKDGVIVDVNDAWKRNAQVVGSPSWSAAVGMSYMEILRRSAAQRPEADEVLSIIQTVMNGRTQRLRYDYRCDVSPQPRWFAATATPLRTRDGGVVICFKDITDVKKVETRYGELVETVRAIVWRAEVPTLRITYASRQGEEILGYPSKRWVGEATFWQDHIHPEDRDWVLAFVTEAIAEKRKHEFECRMIASDGGTVWLRNIVNIIGGNSHSGELVCVSVDITERKEIEAKLRESEARLHLAAQAGKMYAYEWDAVTDEVVRSAECVDLLGEGETTQTTRQELMAQVHPDDRNRVAISCSRPTPQNPNCQVTYRILRLDGGMIWVEKSARAFFDDHGKMLRMIGVVVDITARKRAEEARFRHTAIVESSDDAIISKNLAGVITSWNAAAERIFGYTEAEAVGQSVTILIPAELRDEDAKIQQRLRSGERIEHYETVRVAKDGKEVDVSLTISPVRDSEGEIVGTSKIARDITDRKRAEGALRESEGRFRLVANTAPVLIWMSGPDKLCTYFNQPWLDFTGREFEAELGNGWAEGVHPDDLKACVDTYSKAFDRREEFTMRYRLRRRDGEYRWVADTGVPRFNANQSFAGYIGSCVDVTEHKLAEEALSNVSRKLIEAQERERTRIARELHDDVNQRIALLAIELDLLKQNLPDSRSQVRSRIQEVGKTVSNIGNDIQAIAHRLHSSKLEYLGIVPAIAGFCKELSEYQNVEIHFRHGNVPPAMPPEVALCLFRVLQQALQNGVKHSGVRTFDVELQGAVDEVQLTVSDAGVGFESRSAMTGEGLGLISMRERLHLVKGEISIESRPNHGTTIRARVPLGKEGNSESSVDSLSRSEHSLR